MPLRPSVQLIVYPDRIGKDLKDLAQFLSGPVGDAIGGLHLLPPFPSNADGGFSPLSHQQIDARFGDWDDIERLAQRFDLCLDLVLNHIADASPEFLDYVARGRASPHAGLFIDVDALGEITSDDLAKIHIRKEKEPFREVRFADGRTGRVWCTFTEHQVDLDYRSEATFALMDDNLRFMTERGVKLFRLDAFGYTTKQIGTSCFLVEPRVWEVLEWFRDKSAEYAAEVLPEVHDHPSWQYAIADRGMWCYAFALPPLVLYSLLDADSRYLKGWLRMCPRQQVTVLDTHDGICIPDVEGILPPAAIEALIANVSERSADPILRGSAANVHSVGAIYQLTCTFYDALKRDDDAYIAARAIQLFAPGIPQIYYVGLLAGQNDEALMNSTGELRDINRHFYTLDAANIAVAAPVVQRLLALMRLRHTHPAFSGGFELEYSNDSSVAMGWRHEGHYCRALIDLRFRTVTIDHSAPQGAQPLSFRA
ncbi:MAG: sucrose phosphorylase [Rhodocyclaceae bacterium]|nr:sucrose phosphorylase [Rhodocyclaceae bacterium]